MNEDLFAFEQSPWEAFLQVCPTGSRVSGANLLAMLEGEDDEAVEDAFALMEQRDLLVDLSSLPRDMGQGQVSVRLRREEALAKSGLNPRDLEESDPLRMYLEELAMTPAFGDEALLARQAADGDESAMLALTNLGLGRVVELAKANTGRGVLLMDLIQEGSLGLWQAIQSYTSGDYAAMRDRAILASMGKAVVLQARSGGIGRKMRDAMQDYRAVDERLLSELGRNPTVEEIALELHMRPEEAANVKKMLDDAYLLNQAQAANAPKEPEPEDEQAVEDTAYFQMRQRISDLLSQLSDEDARILTLRFGLEKGLPLTAEQTAAKLGITTQEVAARETAALAKLRNS